MSNEKKAGGIFGGLAAVGAALAVALHTLGHAAEDFGHLLPELPKGDATALLHPMEHSATAVGDGLTGVARQGQGDQIFVSALCNTVAGVANGVPPD